MAIKRNQKKEVIQGVSHHSKDKLTVQKSTPLYGLWRSEITLSEFKLLDIYLSRIDSHDPEHRTVHFDKGEIEQVLGVKQIKADDLKRRLKHLGAMVSIPVTEPELADDPNVVEMFQSISLFEELKCWRDLDGIWQADLTCTPKAMRYIFNIENLGYLRYKLRNITRIKSRYSYILFLYLEKNRYRKTWEVGLEELKHLLNCEEDIAYQQFYRFNERLLKRCHKELSECTECHFSYEPVKRGRSVKAIRFTLETVADQIEGQLSLADVVAPPPVDDDEKAKAYSSEVLGFLAGACDYKFNDSEMRVLFDLILQLYPSNRDGSIERFNYLRRKYNLLTLYDQRKEISDPFAYIKALIEKDVRE